MHGDSTTSPFGFTSPLALRTRQQLEQLRPRYPHEALPIAVFVLTEALRLASVASLARELAAQLLVSLRTHRALPACNAGWAVLSDALSQLAAWYNGNGLLGPVVGRSCRELASYKCAEELVQAGLQRDGDCVLFTAPVGPADSSWIPLFDLRQRLRAKLVQWPGISWAQLIGQEAQALTFGDPPILRNRILGAERRDLLPVHMTWRPSLDGTLYVEADLLRFDCDGARGAVILPGDERLTIACQEVKYDACGDDWLRESHAEHLRSMGWRVHIENSQINSPGATQVIGSARARVNSPETASPAPPGPDASAGPAAARAEPTTETAASADPLGMEKPAEVQDPADQKEMADAAPEVPPKPIPSEGRTRRRGGRDYRETDVVLAAEIIGGVKDAEGNVLGDWAACDALVVRAEGKGTRQSKQKRLFDRVQQLRNSSTDSAQLAKN